MTQPEALPADPFPDLALVYDTPIVQAFRMEPGRYLTVDINGVESNWRLDRDEQAILVAHSISHRVLCNDAECIVCREDIETDDLPDLDPQADPASPVANAIPHQQDRTSASRRRWVTASVLCASTAWLWQAGRRRG
jgi:hypothetical protein